jgi:hypothetical protein
VSRWLRLGTAAVELREPRSHLVEPLLHLAFTMVSGGDMQRFCERIISSTASSCCRL